MEDKNKQPIVREEELYELCRKLLRNKKLILIVTGAFFILGAIAAFTGIKKYTVNVVVAPETSNTSQLGTIGSLASMAGIDISGMNGGSDAIYPLLYPDIVESLPFLVGLLNVPVQSLDGKIDCPYLDYRQKYYRKSFGEKIKSTTKKTAKKIANLFVKETRFLGDPQKIDPYYLSEGQLSLVEGVKKDIHINVDKKTDVITIGFTDQEPKVTAIMADSITARLHKFIISYRTQKAQNDYDYFQKLYRESKTEYEAAQLAYALFRDRNQGLIKESAMIESDRLEAEKELKGTVYTQWAQQLQFAEAKVQESTPAFTILKPAAIPALPSTRRKLATIFLWTVVGFILVSVWILIKDPIKRIISKLKY